MTTYSRRAFVAHTAGAALLSTMPAIAREEKAMKYMLFVGMYTSDDAKGVHVFGVDEGCSQFTKLAVGESVNPSFLAIHPNKKYVFAVNEVGEFHGEKGGGLTAFSLDAKSGAMKPLNHQPTKGGAPCYVSVDAKGKWAMAANYSGGNICSYPIEADGKLGAPVSVIQHEGSSVNTQRQKGPHAHCIYIAPDNQRAYVCDLGLDKVMIYKIDQNTGALTPNDPPYAKLKPGAGPRHIDFHPNGKAAFVINELDSTITVFHYDAKSGALHPLSSVSTLPADFDGNNSCADIHVSSDGKFVYGSNRGHNSIAAFAYDGAKNELTLVQHQSTLGKIPRNFAFDPTGRFLLAANQDSNDVFVFSVDKQSGKLAPTGASFEAHKPVCLKFMTLD